MTAAARHGERTAKLTYRPARTDEIEACAGIWRTSINDYIVKLGQYEIPPDTGHVGRLFSHLQGTDPERFVVGVQPSENDGERVVAFGSAIVRERLWYLSMLFVLPEVQGKGLGRALIERVLPAASAW